MEAARAAFFANGYAATSMSSISAAVGGSKTTLWTYFPSKQDLFAAVVDDVVEHYGRALEVSFVAGEDVGHALRRFGRALLETLHFDPVLSLHRLAIGEAGRFPELGALFHERGAARGKAPLRMFLAAAMERGAIRVGDVEAAIRQFTGMLLAGSPQLRLIGMIDRPADPQLDEEIEAAVDAFARAWGSGVAGGQASSVFG